MPSKPTPLELEYKSIVALAYENPNLLEYIGSLEAEREAMLNFIREIVEIWDSDGDSGFPLYESRKSIVDRYRSLTKIIK